MQQYKYATMENINNNSYLLLRAALNTFGKKPNELDTNELEVARSQAEKGSMVERLVLSSVEASKIVLTRKLITNSFEEIKNRYENEEDFVSDLAANDLDEKSLNEAIYRELLVETVLDKVASQAAKVSEMDVMIYYYLHKDKFTKPETRDAYHILITINDEYEENKREAATARLSDIRKRLLKKTERFSEQAMKHSECPTALREGHLGNIPKGELYPELDEVMFSMKEGEISEIIESPTGLHILYCKKIDNAGPVTLKKAEPKIMEHLQNRRRRMCQKNWLSSLTDNKSKN